MIGEFLKIFIWLVIFFLLAFLHKKLFRPILNIFIDRCNGVVMGITAVIVTICYYTIIIILRVIALINIFASIFNIITKFI